MDVWRWWIKIDKKALSYLNGNRVVDYQCNSCRHACQSRKWRVLANFDIFWPSWAAFVAWEPLCDLDIPSWDLKILLWLFSKKQSGWLVTAAGSSVRAERAFWGDFRVFLANLGQFGVWRILANSGRFCSRETTWSKTSPSLALKKLLRVA